MKHNNADNFDLGTATIRETLPLIAGEYSSIHFTYLAGHPIDNSGYIKIAFRSVADFGVPQFKETKAPNYCSVSTTGDCKIETRWDPKGNVRPWSQCLYLKITRGYLDSGESVKIIFGDISDGSQGWQVQTYCVDQFEFKTSVDPIATYQFKELSTSPCMPIIPGEPSRTVCIAPSQVMVGEIFPYYIKLEDRWGNPTQKPKEFYHPGFQEEGVERITLNDDITGSSAISNPITVCVKEPKRAYYWADFHGQSGESVGDRTIEDYFSFARNYGLLDIAAHSANDFQVTDEFWEKINLVTREYNQPKRFVTFPGYEWSGNTPLGGDRNIYFVQEGGIISRSSTELLPENFSIFENSPTADELFRRLSDIHEPTAFSFAHVGGRYANLDMHNAMIEVAIEIHSAWGTFEWLLNDAFQRGYRVGIVANSDGHKCRPGASYPGGRHFGSLGGLTCVLSTELTRQSIYEALKSRHCYATTGNRALVDINLFTQDGQRALMGDFITYESGNLDLHVKLSGTAPIERVEIHNGSEVIHSNSPSEGKHPSRRVKVIWCGSEVRGRNRMVRWDGSLKVHSNSILESNPINFWNPNNPLKVIDSQQLGWKSVTTGGITGVILTLEDADSGWIEINTIQKQLMCEISSIDVEPETWHCGGLDKAIKIYRLPEPVGSKDIAISIPITELHPGDNPIYIRMVQEDGHMAWSSPIYLIKSE